jgi:hypothetical protein
MCRRILCADERLCIDYVWHVRQAPPARARTFTLQLLGPVRVLSLIRASRVRWHCRTRRLHAQFVRVRLMFSVRPNRRHLPVGQRRSGQGNHNVSRLCTVRRCDNVSMLPRPAHALCVVGAQHACSSYAHRCSPSLGRVRECAYWYGVLVRTHECVPPHRACHWATTSIMTGTRWPNMRSLCCLSHMHPS